MDPCSLQTTPLPRSTEEEEEEEDVWDTDGFIIPSLGTQDSDNQDKVAPAVETQVDEDPKTSYKVRMGQDHYSKEDDDIYLGPHGAPPQSNLPAGGLKQKLKHKLKEADRRNSGSVLGGRENKLENLRDLVGVALKTPPLNTPSTFTTDWLDPHCHESQFDKPSR